MVRRAANQLIFTPLGGRTQIIEKGEGGLSEEATRLSRVAIAHPEGFPLAVANMYCDLADALRAKRVTVALCLRRCAFNGCRPCSRNIGK